MATGVLKQDLDLLAVQASAGGRLLLELGHLALDGVVVDQVVADGDVEDLAEADERLVDRAVAQRPIDPAVLAFTDLRGLVAVDFPGGDLGEAVVFEERQQMMGQRQFVVLDRPRRELVTAAVQPLRGELVEARVVGLDWRGGLRLWCLPGAAADVGEMFCSSVSAWWRVAP